MSALKNQIHTNWGLGIGDWGLGIGDWAQSPIPNTINILSFFKNLNGNKINNYLIK